MANQYQPLQDAMLAGVEQILGQLIDGSLEDLEGPIREIANRLAMAARRRRFDLVAACKDQLMLIVLENRLSLHDAGEGLFKELLGMGVDLLVGAAIGGLGSLRR